MYYVIRFTSLCKMFTYLSFQQKLFSTMYIIFNAWRNLPRLPSIENGAHSTENLLLKTQVSEDFAQRSESIVCYYSARSRWTRYQQTYHDYNKLHQQYTFQRSCLHHTGLLQVLCMALEKLLHSSIGQYQVQL